jgi:ribonuclease D
MDELQLKILNKLMFWRDYIGRVEDESVKFVMNNDVMFGVAKTIPGSMEELEGVLKRFPKHHKHNLIEKNIDSLLKAIRDTIENHNNEILAR